MDASQVVAAVLKVVAAGLVLTLMGSLLREMRGEWGTVVRLVGGALLLLWLIRPLAGAVAALDRLAQLGSIPGAYLGLLLRILGMAYLTTLAARVAYDSGESHLGARIELAGKIAVLVLAVPLITLITKSLLALIPS
ncbi:MAG: stage III sporulation protein AD [Firmicutes bacterium]|nr:stage III sporulation protein AD [Alicyclobacillaceae bacterium]MCL6496668.1 stage III sporulation protein AD [Bacillota bacterium]